MPSSTKTSVIETLSTEALKYWQRIDSGFEAAELVYANNFQIARDQLNDDQIEAWADYAKELGEMGLGAGPMCAFLRHWPTVASLGGVVLLDNLKSAITEIWLTPNKRAIEPMIKQMSRNLHRINEFEDKAKRMKNWLRSIIWLAEKTSISVHGKHLTHPSEALIPYITNSEQPIALLAPLALNRWLENGVHIFEKRPDRLADYCSLKSDEGVAFLAELRDGESLEACSRQLRLVTRGLVDEDSDLIAIPTHKLDEYSDHLARPFYQHDGIRLPDRYERKEGVSPAKRYIIAAMHIYFHQRYSTPVIADNLSPLQRLAVEVFEDTRIDYLLMKRYAGLKAAMLDLLSIPDESILDTERERSVVRVRLALVSRAVLDANFTITHPVIAEFAEKLKNLVTDTNTEVIRDLAVQFIAKTRTQQDQSKDVVFDNTRVTYRDDNRNLWRFIEAGDEEDLFESPPMDKDQLDDVLLARDFPEWDYQLNNFRPKWVSLYEQLQPSGPTEYVDDILLRYRDLVKRLQQIFELIRPHERERVRFQIDGDLMDIDLATEALIDLRSGITPSERIDESIKHDGREIAVYVLVDLSESLNDRVGNNRSMLDLTKEAVSLLSWSISQLGDDYAIGGFSSDTRHRVYYQHVKGFSETLDDTVKGRIGTLTAGFSTRMGTAIRHASDILSKRSAETKILLIITDGEPSDIDVLDDQYLIEDARHAVFECEDDGIYPYCISVDPDADNYIHRIFGSKVAVIDAVERLPERVTKIFLDLTR